MKYKNISRIRIVSVGVLIVALVFIMKLYVLQVIQHKDFVILADKQYTRPSNSVFDRGTIFFQSKNGDLISAATLSTGFTVALNPKKTTDATSTYEKLNAVTPIDRDFFFSKANLKSQSYIEIIKKVPEEKGKAIDALDLPGVSVYKDQWRFYPAGQTASGVLGLVAYKGDDLVGRYGLERFYENILGRKNEDLYANFFVQVFSNLEHGDASSTPAGNIVATIEPTVQATLESALRKIQTSWSSAETGGIIMNPKTGEIYAMASMPTFDPNNFQGEKNVSVFSNPLVENVYEMGSIIKPLTMAAGLDAGVITPTTTYFDTGEVTANNMTIHNHDLIKNGVTSMQDVLNDSLNTGAAFVAGKLTQNKFADYMFAYGFGEKTGIDLPNEAQDIVGGLRSKQQIDYITASFGQGIAMTPIATIRALATLANGGQLVTPHVVSRINYESGLFKNIAPPASSTPALSKKASDDLTAMLIKTVDTALLAGAGKNAHYTVAAKTGTAQIAKPGGGGYYTDRFLHSFMGYFPATDPKFIILLYTYYPKTNLFAANTLGPSFFDLSKFLFNYYQIPPDR